MSSVVVGVETDEVAIQDPKQDLTTDGKDPNTRRFQNIRLCFQMTVVGEGLAYL